jgi:hypothetical protein
MSKKQILFFIISASNSRILESKNNGFFPNPLTVLESVVERNGCNVRYGSFPYVSIYKDGEMIGCLSLSNCGKWSVVDDE